MKAVLLAGGEGTRLRPLTSNQSKPMMPVANRPMMEHIVRLLAEHGFDEIVVTVAFLANSLLVKHQIPNKQGTLRDRLWRCAESGALQKGDAAALDHAAELLRTTEHAVRLVTGRALKSLPATEHGRRTVEKLTSKILRANFEKGLEAELDCTCRKVRAIYERALVSLAPSN